MGATTKREREEKERRERDRSGAGGRQDERLGGMSDEKGREGGQGVGFRGV